MEPLIGHLVFLVGELRQKNKNWVICFLLCVEGTLKRKPFEPVGKIQPSRKLQLVRTDVRGPMNTESLGGHTYFVTCIDDFTRCCKVYIMKQTSEVLDKFKQFEAIMTNAGGFKIAKIRSDNGGEYISHACLSVIHEGKRYSP